MLRTSASELSLKAIEDKWETFFWFRRIAAARGMFRLWRH
jgi:hypothetical protein